ncbi:MAG TPA: sugar phosphate isomerase/epimerase family protein [Bryobacteraceae bacterium]|nr:sugar phosphate isomerase/epimerase family protein [Bryobacteraceae bacterium]
MKPEQIGCSPGYTFAHYGLDSTLERFLWSLDRLGSMGYRNFGLEILEPVHTCIYRTPGAIEQLGERSRAAGVALNHFTIWHCTTNLHSVDPERRRLGVRQFTEGCEIARDLGIPLVTVGSDWPPEWVSSYRGEYEHAPAAEFFVASPAEYSDVWNGYVDAMRRCLETAAQRGVKLGVEPRANSLLATSDSFLRLWDAVRSDNLYCVLDAMHAVYHRENLPAAIKKLGPRLVTLQISGTDGASLNHLPLAPGDPVTTSAVRALEEIGFPGTVDVEMYGMPAVEVDECYRQAREILEHT